MASELEKETMSRKVKRGRYRLDCYQHGEAAVGERSMRAYNGRAHFETAEAALEDWLATGWEYERPEAFDTVPGWDPADALLVEAAFIVDRKDGRVVFVVTYRWPELGESRLPVATVLDVAAGTIRTVRVEDQPAAP